MNDWYPQENAALCDEVAHLEEKFLRAKEERRWVDGIKMVLDNWCVQQGLSHSSNFTPFFCTKTKWLIHVSIPFSFSRFLLKSLLQYQSLSEGEILPTPSSSAHPPVPPVALTSGPAGASGLSGGHNLVSMVSTGEDGPLKKPKKERRERGRENGKEERECWNKIIWVEVKREIHFTRQLAPYFISFSCDCSVPKKMSKKRKLADGSRKLVQPIPLDSSGRPVFPIVLGGLTVYSLGEVSGWFPSLALLSLWSLILTGTHAIAMLWQVQLSNRWWFNE